MKALAFHQHGGLVMRQLFDRRLTAVADTVGPPRDGADAQRRLAEGRQFGKIVLVP